ncbi:aromatic ring-hydroxylating oxygenase subunit alpha [Roseovarius phycicola]|uniref:Aromatic ring-hydroxylating dioxygenase subunit alpha n=1 Tax=Roseovarius phycicola TaxID=3080976 RepID=A0ABZ2HI27_9RHOB
MLDKSPQPPKDDVEHLRRELQKRAGHPAEEAWAMPALYYTSPAFLEAESDEVLRREWMCIGHVGELRKPGDFFTTELLGEQLLAVHSEDGVIRVLSNVCRHRGNLVAEGRGSARKFVCSYHAWAYDTAGALKVAPFMKHQRSFDQSKCSLPEFASEVWMGWLFVNLDGTAAPLSPRLEGLKGVIGNYHQDERHLVFLEEDVWGCNWKALFENFMEGYHLSATHLTTLHPVTPTKLCQKMVSGDAWTGFHACYDPDYPPREPFHPDLTEFERNNSPMYGVFPNLLVGMGTDFTLFMIIRPDGPEKVHIRWGVTGQEDAPEAEATQTYVNLCKSFNVEDKEKLETLQLAMRTRNFSGGPLAPDEFEGTIWDFIQYMGVQMGR